MRQYNDPDQRGGLLRTSPPSGLSVFVPLAALFVLAVVVASVVKVNVTARGRGIVRPNVGVAVLRAPVRGTVHVASADLGAGASVEGGTRLFRVGAEWVEAPYDGRLDAWRVMDGTTVDAGAPLAKVIPGAELVAELAIPAEHRGELEAGDEVRLRMDEYPARSAGFGRATVVHVASEPMQAALADPMLATAATLEQPHYLVALDPVAMPPQANADFRSGMTFTGEVVLREQRIIELLLSF